MTSAAKTILEGKADLTLLPYEGLCAAAGGFEDGIRPGKYERNDWRKGMPWSVPVAAILRHASRIAGGELIDPDSGRAHSEHIAARSLMLAHYVATGTGVNDLTKEGNDMAIGQIDINGYGTIERCEQLVRVVNDIDSRGMLHDGMGIVLDDRTKWTILCRRPHENINVMNVAVYPHVEPVEETMPNYAIVEDHVRELPGFTTPAAPAEPAPLQYDRSLIQMFADYVTRTVRLVLGVR